MRDTHEPLLDDQLTATTEPSNTGEHDNVARNA
jgi:hypothetical protein